MSSPITTHVLDTALGRPAAGLRLRLERLADDGSATLVTEATTNEDGRVAPLMAPGSLAAVTYRMTFDTGPYFAATHRTGFYPYVSIVFTITAPDEHHHVPLLLSPYGYSTYRGS
jgi:5-hydroxyisourate hydrolase